MPVHESDRRSETRHAVCVPIQIAQVGTGFTIDLSSRGIAFLIDRLLELGAAIEFQIVLAQHEARLLCNGRVVRVEARDGATFVAATIHDIDVKSTTGH
jgi:hypothetical protein